MEGPDEAGEVAVVVVLLEALQEARQVDLDLGVLLLLLAPAAQARWVAPERDFLG